MCLLYVFGMLRSFGIRVAPTAGGGGALTIADALYPLPTTHREAQYCEARRAGGSDRW